MTRVRNDSLINERIALHTHSVSSEPLGEQDPTACYFPDN